MTEPQHHINVETDDGTKVLSFRGLAIPRVGDRMKLTSTIQKILGEFEVTDVRWMVTNAGSGPGKFVSKAQAEVWARPWAPKKRRRWFVHLFVALCLVAFVVAAGAGLVAAGAYHGVLP